MGFLRLTARGHAGDASAADAATLQAALKEGGSEIAIAHILPFEDARIAGRWDIAQAAPSRWRTGTGCSDQMAQPPA